MNIIEELRELYYLELEKNGEPFLTISEHFGRHIPDDGYFESEIIEKYAHASVEQMCDYLEMPDWITKWTIELAKGQHESV